MTPEKKKAMELFMFHLSLISIATKYPDCKKLHKEHRGVRRQQAKDHTIKTVDEIIKEQDRISKALSKLFDAEMPSPTNQYWQQVKTEIEKL